MFHYLFYSVTITESKGKFRIVFCCFSETKNIVGLSSSSNFPTKLIYWGILVFVCLDKTKNIYLYIEQKLFGHSPSLSIISAIKLKWYFTSYTS